MSVSIDAESVELAGALLAVFVGDSEQALSERRKIPSIINEIVFCMIAIFERQVFRRTLLKAHIIEGVKGFGPVVSLSQ